MDALKETIAKNLVQLRTQAKLTQAQLAEKLNYSDKAVSKWERGEAIPDLRVLIQLARLYDITLDDIVNTSSVENIVKPRMNIGKKRLLITLLSAGLVWFIATVVFTVFYFVKSTEDYAFLSFVVAPFACSVVLMVMSAMWGNRITNMIASSLIIWTLALLLHIFVITFKPFDKIGFLYVVAAVFEILVILWFILRRFIKRKK
ncbi:MAG: helix-turn-helix domain-containing protein [Clostridia bacterium]|nr:helix-turn-helix domain-containing protein [Clostridia bacterium]